MIPPVLDYQARQSRFSDFVEQSRRPASLFRSLGLMTGWIAVAAMIFGCGMGGSVVPCLLLVLGTSMMLRSIRRRRGMAVLGYLDQAMRMNQPLPEALSAAAAGESRYLRKRLYSVRDALVGGVPVGMALEVCVPEIPLETARLIASAEVLGAARGVLRSVVHAEQARSECRGDEWFFARFYPLVVASMSAFIVFFVVVRVTPKFVRIFKDFKMDPGPWCKGLLFFTENFGVAVLVLLVGYILIYIALRLWEIFLPRDRQTFWQNFLDFFSWHTPVVAGHTRSGCLASAMQILAAGVGAGFALPDGLLQAIRLRRNRYFTRRLETWHGAVLSGASPADAARQAGMPALVVGMLNCAPASLPDTLRFLAVHYRERSSRIATVIRAAIIPGMTLAFSVLVFWLAMAMFDPMVRLIKVSLPMGGFHL